MMFTVITTFRDGSMDVSRFDLHRTAWAAWQEDLEWENTALSQLYRGGILIEEQEGFFAWTF